MEASEKRTEINQIGEFRLIDRLTDNLKLRHKENIMGVGDDAAVIELDGICQVVTTDLLIEGVHFDMMYVPLKHLGYKAVIVNLSDVVAMNATPKQITFSMAVSNRFSVEAIEELYEGVIAACDAYNVDLIGGDTTSSTQGLMISVTALGYANKDKIAYRSGANVGDLICVSGDLGGAYAGLQLMEREKKLFLEDPKIQPELEEQQYLVGRQLKPEARFDLVQFFDENMIQPTAMIDVSDGLSSDLLHICHRSSKGCVIREADIPIHSDTYNMAVKFNLDPNSCALSGGEDYELLFTIKAEDREKVDAHIDISIIGEITKPDDGYKFETKGGNFYDITSMGWDSFSEDKES